MKAASQEEGVVNITQKSCAADISLEGKEEDEYKLDSQEEKELDQNDKAQTAVTIDLGCLRTLYHKHPTLPHLLTEYGMEDKNALYIKKPREKKRKMKKSFDDDDSLHDKEKDKQREEKHLKIVNDMIQLRDHYYDEYMALLKNKVNQQRQEIHQRDSAMQSKVALQDQTARQEGHHVKQRLARRTFVSDDSFLKDIPKTDSFHIVQLQDMLIRDGTLKSQTDCDAFWKRIQQPDIFYMCFKVPKSNDFHHYEDYNDNASNKATVSKKASGANSSRHVRTFVAVTQKSPTALSRISESQETTSQRSPLDQHHSGRRSQRGYSTVTKLTYLQELEKRFPKLEMPQLHTFTMNLKSCSPDPIEISHGIEWQKQEKKRKNYSSKLTKMHQMAMANSALASRILELHEDMGHIIKGTPLTDLISDHHFYTGLLPVRPSLSQRLSAFSLLAKNEALKERVQSFVLEESGSPSYVVESSELQFWKPSKSKSRKKKKKLAATMQQELVESESVPEKPAPVPLSMSQLAAGAREISAKCVSTLWSNYNKDASQVKS